METNRRNWLKAVAAPLFVPASAWGANDRPAYGWIGTGSRGGSLNRSFQKLGAQCVAVCDVYEPHLENGRRAAGNSAKAYADHRELLQQNGIDFVVIATPDHHHAPQLFDSLGAAKDVYLEKPLSMSLDESARMIEAVRKTDRVVQIGMQRRSMPFIHKAKKLVDDGALGRISMVKALWNWHFAMPLDNSPLPGKLDWERFQGGAPRRPMEPMRFRWWRGFFDYSGGNMTDHGTHLMDVVQWMTGAGAPQAAVCLGAQILMPGGDVPNVFSAVFEYPDFVATWTLNYRTTHENDWSIEFYGERAAMILDRRGCRIYKDKGASPEPWSVRGDEELILEEQDRDSADLHMKNFLDCIRTRQQPNCPIEVAARAAAGPHLANLAYRHGKKARLGKDGREAV